MITHLGGGKTRTGFSGIFSNQRLATPLKSHVTSEDDLFLIPYDLFLMRWTSWQRTHTGFIFSEPLVAPFGDSPQRLVIHLPPS